jgi:hypothetical protein
MPPHESDSGPLRAPFFLTSSVAAMDQRSRVTSRSRLRQPQVPLRGLARGLSLAA